jgi:hypothetical protein
VVPFSDPHSSVEAPAKIFLLNKNGTRCESLPHTYHTQPCAKHKRRKVKMYTLGYSHKPANGGEATWSKGEHKGESYWYSNDYGWMLVIVDVVKEGQPDDGQEKDEEGEELEEEALEEDDEEEGSWQAGVCMCMNSGYVEYPFRDLF